MYSLQSRCGRGGAKGDRGKEAFLVLPDHCIVRLSAMCRDSFHWSLMNYCCVIIVIACVWKGGRVSSREFTCMYQMSKVAGSLVSFVLLFL